jgi:NB-ARC domain
VTGPLRVRMGVHTGAAQGRDGDYFGPALNRAARLMAVAHGGQVLVSLASQAIVGDEVDLIDLGEHRLRDLSRPEHVYQLTADGLVSDFPPLRSLGTLPSNLPVQLTSFVGRDAELHRIRKLIGEHRVVTITGVGGVGKTRLALQLAGELVGEFQDGAWVLELGPVTDADGVLQVVAATFGVQLRTGMTLEDSIVEFLRRKDLLWVLDNCGHLVESVGRLVDRVLRASAALRVLTTSREALDVDGECAMPLRSMTVTSSALPPPGDAARDDQHCSAGHEQLSDAPRHLHVINPTPGRTPRMMRRSLETAGGSSRQEW